MSYYWQSVRGQFDIWGRERPITEVIEAPATSAALKDKLALALKARAFARKRRNTSTYYARASEP